MLWNRAGPADMRPPSKQVRASSRRYPRRNPHASTPLGAYWCDGFDLASRHLGLAVVSSYRDAQDLRDRIGIGNSRKPGAAGESERILLQYRKSSRCHLCYWLPAQCVLGNTSPASTGRMKSMDMHHGMFPPVPWTVTMIPRREENL